MKYATLRWVPSILVIGLLWLASSCASIEHVSLLRAEQERFSAAATRENQDVQRFLFPGQHDIITQIELWDGRTQLRPVSNIETLETVCQEYGYVKASLDTLLTDKAKELQQDNLLGIARALYLFTSWRASYCRYMLNALEARSDSSAPPGSPPALTEIAQRAAALSSDDQAKAQLGPRDLLLLMLIPGIARYEAATIQVVRDHGYAEKPEAERRQLARGWIAQMLQADQEIEQGFTGSRQGAVHLQDYYLSTRRLILLTANNIEVRADLAGGLEGPQGQESLELMKTLYSRIDNFEEAVRRSGLAAEAKTGLTQRLPTQGSSLRSPLP